MAQPTLFESSAAELGSRLRDRAIQIAGDNAPDIWWQSAAAAIRTVAATHSEWTTDHVWSVLDDLGAQGPPEPRAMGAAMRAAQAAGLCAPTDRVVPTDRPNAHRRPVRVWRTV